MFLTNSLSLIKKLTSLKMSFMSIIFDFVLAITIFFFLLKQSFIIQVLEIMLLNNVTIYQLNAKTIKVFRNLIKKYTLL